MIFKNLKNYDITEISSILIVIGKELRITRNIHIESIGKLKVSVCSIFGEVVVIFVVENRETRNFV